MLSSWLPKASPPVLLAAPCGHANSCGRRLSLAKLSWCLSRSGHRYLSRRSSERYLSQNKRIQPEAAALNLLSLNRKIATNVLQNKRIPSEAAVLNFFTLNRNLATNVLPKKLRRVFTQQWVHMAKNNVRSRGESVSASNWEGEVCYWRSY